MPKKKKQQDIEKFAQLVKSGVEAKGLLSQFELEADAERQRVGQQVMDEKLASLPEEDGKPKACPRCGKKAWVRRKNVPRTFRSLNGTHTIRRNIHYCEACKEGFAPRDEFMGLPKEGELSSELERRMADFVVNDPFELAEERWNLHYPKIKTSKNQLRNVAKRLGERAEEADMGLLQSALLPVTSQQSATVYCMSDGSMVPMKDEWREVKVGTVFRVENHLTHLEASRGIISQARFVAHLGGQEEFKEQLQTTLKIEAPIAAREVVFIADGAPENWTLASAIAPGATQILDWYHAIQNTMYCGKALFGEENAVALEWWAMGMKAILAAGKVDLLVQTLMSFVDENVSDDELTALDALVRYLRNNEERMRYDEFRERNLLIGSGPIESAQRHVIQTRMKRSGQHWSEDGARRMARLRAAVRTSGPERFYDAVHWAYRESIRHRGQLDQINLKRKPPKRRASNR